MLGIKRAVFLITVLSVVFFIWLGQEQEQMGEVNTTVYAQPGHIAPDFTLNTFENESFTFSENVGDQGTVLYFWTSWCPYCKASSEAIQQAHDTYGDEVAIIGVNAAHQDPAGEAEQFIEEYNLTFTQLMDENGAVSSSYYVPPVPVTLFIDNDGVVAQRKTGAVSSPELHQEIQALIEGGS